MNTWRVIQSKRKPDTKQRGTDTKSKEFALGSNQKIVCNDICPRTGPTQREIPNLGA